MKADIPVYCSNESDFRRKRFQYRAAVWLITVTVMELRWEHALRTNLRVYKEKLWFLGSCDVGIILILWINMRAGKETRILYSILVIWTSWRIIKTWQAWEHCVTEFNDITSLSVTGWLSGRPLECHLMLFSIFDIFPFRFLKKSGFVRFWSLVVCSVHHQPNWADWQTVTTGVIHV